jgi:hypothetical protein
MGCGQALERVQIGGAEAMEAVGVDELQHADLGRLAFQQG